MSNLIKPPILDDTGQTIKTKLTAILQSLQNAGNVFIPKTQKGAASGVAELDSSGKVPTGQIPTLSQYMVKGTDYVTAGQASGSTLGTGATAEGVNNTASGKYSHVEGSNSTASGESSHAGGHYGHAIGKYSFSGGNNTYARETGSFAIGTQSEAKHSYSVAEGNYTQTGASYQHVMGMYNVGKANTFLEIGNGTYNNRNNVFEVNVNGDAFAGRSNGIDVSTAQGQKKIPTSQDVVSYLNSNFPDSGWLETTAVNGNTVYYRRIGKMVIYRRGKTGTVAANTSVTIGTIPSAYRMPYNESHSYDGGSVTFNSGDISIVTVTANYVVPFVIVGTID